MDFKQPAEIIRCARRPTLLPEETLQEDGGTSGEHCPGQGPHPCPGGRLFLHMAGGKPVEGVWHSTILVHSREKSVLLLWQTTSLPPVHLLPSKNTCLQCNADPCRCCLGEKKLPTQSRAPWHETGFILRMVNRAGTFHVGSCSF